MSTEYIREINIWGSDVYLCSKPNNDNLPYNTWRCSGLSAVYQAEGQRGLDREILRMLLEYAQVKGDHPSVRRYTAAMKQPEARRLIVQLQDRPGVQLSMTGADGERERLYRELAAICGAYHRQERRLRYAEPTR